MTVFLEKVPANSVPAAAVHEAAGRTRNIQKTYIYMKIFTICLPYILGHLNTDGSFFVLKKKRPNNETAMEKILRCTNLFLKIVCPPVYIKILSLFKGV